MCAFEMMSATCSSGFEGKYGVCTSTCRRRSKSISDALRGTGGNKSFCGWAVLLRFNGAEMVVTMMLYGMGVKSGNVSRCGTSSCQSGLAR